MLMGRWKPKARVMMPKYHCDDDVEYPVEGESLVARRALSAQVKEDDMEQQRANIFHTKCEHLYKETCFNTNELDESLLKCSCFFIAGI
jgi:hypothetical protein